MQAHFKARSSGFRSCHHASVRMRRERRVRLPQWLALLPAVVVPACAQVPNTKPHRGEPAPIASPAEPVENWLGAAGPAAGEAPAAARALSLADDSDAAASSASGTGEVVRVDYEAPDLAGPVVSDRVPVPPEIDGSVGSDQLPPPLPLGDLATGDTFTVEALEQIALANNPSLQQAQAVVNKARGVSTQVGLYPNPTLGYLGNEIGDDGTAGKQGGYLSQTIVTGGKLKWNRTVAEREVQNLLWELDAQRYRVRNAVRTKFYEALGAQRRVEITQELVGVAQEGVRASEQLVAARQVARPDLLQARIQFNQVDILLKNARYDYDAAWSQLASLVGQPDLAPRPLAGSLSQPDAPERDLETTLTELLATSPQLRAARARVDRARAQLQRQRVQPIPNLITRVAVAHDNASGDDIANLQLGLPIPVFNRNQGGIRLAIGEYRRAESEARRIELALRTRLAATFRDYRQTENQVRQYRDEILPTAEENLDLTEKGYRVGELDLIRVLTARQSYFESSLAYVRSQVALKQADVKIAGLLLTGGLDGVADVTGSNLQGIGLRNQALGGQ